MQFKLLQQAKFAFCVLFLTIEYPGVCNAQIVPDATLPTRSTVQQLQDNTDNTQLRIEGGTRAGNNLFHSFSEFSVPNNSTAIFNNSGDVQNILTRVTGNTRSDINGIIKANNPANLFLINPNGIIFGPNARLDIGGSFLGSTANAIGFGDLGNFSATNPEAPSPLLTINPSALLFSQIQTSSIETSSVASDGRNPSNAFEARGLRVDDGKSLLLVGGDVSVNGGGLYAFGGRVELGGLASAGTVGLNGDGNNLSLSFPNSVERSNVSLSNGAQVNVRAGNGGSIALNARNLEMTGRSSLYAGIESGLGSDNSKAGNIEVNAQGTLNLKDSSNISNSVQSEATGQAGDINISTGSLTLTNGAELVATTYGRGDAGNVIINARDTVRFDGRNSSGFPSGAFTNVESQNAVGNGGVININTGSLYLSNGAVVNARTRGQGDGGNVNIKARETVSFDGSNATSTVESTGVGKGGDISIDTSFLTLANGAELRTSTYGQGDAGSVIIIARERIDFVRGYVFSTLEKDASGKSGNINITTGSLDLTNGAELVATSYGRGDAGNVNIKAGDTVRFDGVGGRGRTPSGAFSNVESQDAVGKGGVININTGSLYLSNGAIVNARTRGQGDGGNVNIIARETVSFDGSNATSTVESTGVGKGGDISIDTSFLTLANGAQLSTSTSGQGDAGSVIIIASDRIDFDRGYVFSTLGDGASGKSGNITITTGSLALTNGAELVATTYGRGDAGNVIINARDTVRFDGVEGSSGTPSGAFTNVESQNAVGKGGDININTGSLYLSNGAIVQARTIGQGNGGNVNINAREAVSFDRSYATSLVGSTGVGKGGNITIDTSFLTLANGAQLSTTTSGKGDAGNVIINARQRIDFDRSNATSSVSSTGVGKGGDIKITTGLLEILNRAELSATTEASNNTAGNIDVKTNSIRLDQSTISADTTAGQGNINLRSRDLILLRGSNITTNARGSNVIGGNIDINTDVLALLQGSNIAAKSANSRGGNINIKTQGLFRSLDSSITASGATSALSGNVNITTLADPSKDLVPLTVDVVDVARLVDDNICARTAKSSFTAIGRGGIPDSPDTPAVSNFSWEDWRLLSVSKQQRSVTVRNTPISNTSSRISNQIVEAQGWVIDKDGSVILTAAYPVSLSQNNLLSQCHL
ncbi:hypothetical protein NIES2101_17865 [Calothrix sp. HK-06]|nr:hypothetical protein NIES2101_17865 [Calothrix sp. HK-06]